jgi:hypothetical protein
MAREQFHFLEQETSLVLGASHYGLPFLLRSKHNPPALAMPPQKHEHE